MSKNRNLPITVFMAAYNASAYIKESISSILNQTFSDFELLIVDDGSTDNTVEIIKRINDSRIRLIRNEENKGLGYTRNIALNAAKGEFLAILDSDDIAFPNRLERQMEIFKSRPNLALLGSFAHIINKNGRRTGEKIYPNVGTDRIKATLLFANSFAHSTVMMRTSIFKAVGGYPNHTVAQDYALISRVALKHEIDNLPEYLVEYRIHDDNISSRKKALVRDELTSILSFSLSSLLPNFNDKDIEIILDPINQSRHSLEDYFKTYSHLLINNKKKGQYPIDELIQILCNNWYTIVMEKGRSGSVFQLLRPPIFDKRYVSWKQIRKAGKRSIYYLTK